MKSIASIYESRKQFGEAAEWYKKIVETKKDPGKTDMYNAGIGFYRVEKYQQAIEMFDRYILKFPDDIYGYYYKGSAQAGIDTSMTMGIAFPSYLKAVEVGEAYPDKSRITPLIKGSYRFLVIFAANVLKNKEQALSFNAKALILDSADTEFKGFKESISKMTNPSKTYTNAKGEKVTIEADGSITTVGKDGSTTVISKTGKITIVKNGITTIIENGKMTVIDKDGKVTSMNPPGSLK
ncbi:MAG: tetratricopeptide repeat protein [Chitinophagaceae bacterium]|nr:tetratricopeptide repeat protein [Chitinophagaceae bacterium]